MNPELDPKALAAKPELMTLYQLQFNLGNGFQLIFLPVPNEAGSSVLDKQKPSFFCLCPQYKIVQILFKYNPILERPSTEKGRSSWKLRQNHGIPGGAHEPFDRVLLGFHVVKDSWKPLLNSLARNRLPLVLDIDETLVVAYTIHGLTKRLTDAKRKRLPSVRQIHC